MNINVCFSPSENGFKPVYEMYMSQNFQTAFVMEIIIVYSIINILG